MVEQSNNRKVRLISESGASWEITDAEALFLIGSQAVRDAIRLTVQRIRGEIREKVKGENG